MSATLRVLITERAGSTAEAPFLVCPDDRGDASTTQTYGALEHEIARIETVLRRLGSAPGESVAFLLENGWFTASLLLANAYAGRVSVPLNAVAGRDALQYALEHSGARIVLGASSLRERLMPLPESLAERVRWVDTDADHGPLSMSDIDAAPIDWAPIDAQTPALLLYTSGTTGRPKGALLSHANLLAGGRNVALAHALSARDRALCVLPLYHINAIVVTLMGPLVSGGSVIMPRRFQASRFWDQAVRGEASWCSVVPTIINYLLQRAEQEHYRFGADPRLARLRFARSASAPLAPAVLEAFESVFHLPMIETMGLTETAAPILSNPLPPLVRKAGSPGIVFGNEVDIVDERDGVVRRCAPNEVGELWVRGENVIGAYHRNRDATDAAFSPDGWFRTGDLGYCDDEGYFFITGRQKELIIRGGENIAPREIDDVLYRLSSILEAAAVGVPDPNYGQEVVACVVLREGASSNEAALIAACQAQLGPYKSPKKIYFFNELPKGPSGKIQRLKLLDWLTDLDTDSGTRAR